MGLRLIQAAGVKELSALHVKTSNSLLQFAVRGEGVNHTPFLGELEKALGSPLYTISLVVSCKGNLLPHINPFSGSGRK